MKYSFLVFIVVLSFSLKAQQETFTLTELDSITTKNSKRDKASGIREKDSLNFEIVESVPVYKGCENEIRNKNKKECMNEKVADFFKKNFDTTLPKDSKVPSGKIRIFVTFIVNEEGKVVEGIANGPDTHFENEAIRVLNLLPKLTPGYYKGEPIRFPFSLPLVAVVENENLDLINTTYPVYRGCSKDLSYQETKSCTTEKIMDYIRVSFDYELAERVFPTEISTKFLVEFTINDKGKTEQINVKAHHKAIAIDVINLIKRMPKFKVPGSKDGKPTSTKFSVLMTIRLLS
ncbi:hypothetical protein DFQ11_10464 [Winogradskyella epiphytica]|uniref:TonB-like protein n=1 Tax=Winogradskyella epiphytica TaxID=262005 RepID=A0A2V4XY77_9FLAO|nr:hypothetical protein [Winogradskyella epiphytica]PYE80698.1 hypothetical protein DFQ11_10464 [Winogradskyella epiphytica]GGW67800.1 hypothetical protein GCM10008085_19600 [Winogradskyella epiphytica]